MPDKKQIIIIRGGDSFENEEEFLNYLKTRKVSPETFQIRTDWKRSLADDLGQGFSVLMPEMPCKENARYEYWKIWFERMIPYMDDEVILIGNSLGGTFLAKYLAENDFSKKIDQLHFVAPAHNRSVKVKDFTIPDNLENISNQVEKIYIYHSQDDTVVPTSDFEIFTKALPKAKAISLDGYGHFWTNKFPEIIENIMKG